jgi:hypothetical protein
MIVVIVMMFCMVFIAVGAYLFLNRPQEGDECEGKDENGNYEIDDKGKCVLDSCASGYYKSGKECLVDQSGEECVPEGTPDPKGTYLTDQMGGCELNSCESGYVKEGDECTMLRGKYETYPDHDFTGGDIACTTDEEATACEAKCDADDRCVSYIHTANDKICCTKFGTQNYTNMPARQITAYIKNIDGYEVKEIGDRPAGDIENMNPGTLPTCKARCDELDNCIGFNFNNNNCWIKKAEGISPTYSVNGYQFYTKL